MKTFGVSTSGDVKVIVRTDETVEEFAYKSKRAANKKIMELLSQGYIFDATHETLVYTNGKPAVASGGRERGDGAGR
jgi:hypothetical protein